jgi:7-cyano-7-deazaguanine reductase
MVFPRKAENSVSSRLLSLRTDALAAATAPRYLKLTARFNVRGGIYTTVVATRRKAGWNPEPTVTLP